MKSMRSHAAFKSYKKIILDLLKRTFRLPLRGSPSPLWELFFRFQPENIIVRNFLANQAKWFDIYICKKEDNGENIPYNKEEIKHEITKYLIAINLATEHEDKFVDKKEFDEELIKIKYGNT